MTRIILVHRMNVTVNSWGSLPEKLNIAGRLSTVLLPQHDMDTLVVSNFY